MSKRDSIEQWIIKNVRNNPRTVAKLAETEFGVSRTYVNSILRDLVADGVLLATGATKARKYELVRHANGARFPLDGSVDEHELWRTVILPTLEERPIDPNAMNILNYAATEMINNAIDHSTGSFVELFVSYDAQRTTLVVEDDGVGIFKKIMAETGAEDEHHALLDLAKGRLTTDPKRHTGEGIFFTSRACDLFSINSHHLHFMGGADGSEWAQDHSEFVNGTEVFLQVDNHTGLSLQELFDRFSGPDSYTFDITHVPVSLARVGKENLVSRSQAKRLLTRIAVFDKVMLDFASVDTVGQAFADELFRVFPIANPDTEIVAMNMSPEVERMVMRAVAARHGMAETEE